MSRRCNWTTCCGIAASCRCTRRSHAIARGRCSISSMHGLLAAFMNPPEDEVEFNLWYDEEHVPNRLAVAGFLNGRRYKAAEDDGPRYLALYELSSLDVLHGEAYQRLIEERSEREKDMLARIPMIDRRVLELVIDGPPWTDDGPPYQLIVCMSPPPGGEDDFVAWYREDHIDMLREVPDQRR